MIKHKFPPKSHQESCSRSTIILKLFSPLKMFTHVCVCLSVCLPIFPRGEGNPKFDFWKYNDVCFIGWLREEGEDETPVRRAAVASCSLNKAETEKVKCFPKTSVLHCVLWTPSTEISRNWVSFLYSVIPHFIFIKECRNLLKSLLNSISLGLSKIENPSRPC